MAFAKTSQHGFAGQSGVEFRVQIIFARCRERTRGYAINADIIFCKGAGCVTGQLGNTEMYAGWSTMYNLNAYLMQLNDSFFSLRTRQIAAAVQMLHGFPESAGQPVTLYAEKEFSRYADLAALLTGTAVCSDEDYQPFEEIVAERFHDQTWSHAWVLPGALTRFDEARIKSLLRQEGLCTANPACAAK